MRRGAEVLGSADEMERWLDRSLPSLNGLRPRDLLVDIAGVRMVLQYLGRINQGVYT